MPTGSRLAGAICFAFLAFLVSGMIIPLLPDGTKTQLFGVINAIVGFVCGWKIMGPRAPLGFRPAIGAGLTTSVAMSVVALFIHSSTEMVKLSLRKYYKGGTEAIIAIFEIAYEYAQIIATPEVIGTLLIGGMICGYFTRIASRHWA